MFALSIAPLTKAGFVLFGDVVEIGDVKPKLINEVLRSSFDDLAGIDVAAEGGEVNVSLFIGSARPAPLVIKLMERDPLGANCSCRLAERPGWWWRALIRAPLQATGHRPRQDDRA